MDTFFVLPPNEAYYFQQNHPNYRQIPPLAPKCIGWVAENTFRIIYPQHLSELVATKDLNGKVGNIVFVASSPNPNAVLYWHVDNVYLGETKGEHRISYQPKVGRHVLSVVDAEGNTHKIVFTILA
jgi:penicillin-binding protein 1C